MEVYSTCPKCGCRWDWEDNQVERTPDGGIRPAPSPNCPRCRYDVTASNELATRDVRWYAQQNDVAGLGRLLHPNWRNLFGLFRPNIDQRNARGFTPLMNAAQHGSKDAVAFLLLHGADPTATDKAGQTALDKAQAYQHPEIVSLLTRRT